MKHFEAQLYFNDVCTQLQDLLKMQGTNRDEQLEKQVEEVFKRLKELQQSKDWIDNGNKPCQKYKMNINGRIAAKGVSVCDYNIDKVFAFLEKEESLPKLNNQCIEMKVLYEKKDVFKVNYQQYKAIWPVSNRDFVSVGASRKEEGGSKIYIGTTSCKYPHPQVKGIVRGEIYIGGYILEKVDETHTKVTYISDANLAGSIPGMVQNQLSQVQGDVASRVGSCMKKNGY